MIIRIFFFFFFTKTFQYRISWLHGAAQPVILKELKTTNLFYDEGGKTKVYAWTPFITLSGQNPPEEYVLGRILLF